MYNDVLESLEETKYLFTYNHNYINITTENILKFYLGTNENINGYLNLFDFENKEKALSVLASGDHPFNLVTKGIMNIDTFDINKLTEYYALGLKRGMILKYDYQTYLNTINIISNKNSRFTQVINIIKDIIPNMDKEYKLYWNKLIDFLYKDTIAHQTQKNIFNNLSKENYSSFNTVYNNYLLTEENYNLLKSRLGSANITFKQCNAINLKQEFKKEFDIIILSNILDYFCEILGMNWGYKELKKYEKGLEKISRNNAYIFLNYIFEYYNKGELVFDSSITKKNLTDEQIIKIPNSPLNGAILLKRVKK